MSTHSLKTRLYLVLFTTAMASLTFGTQAEGKHRHSKHHRQDSVMDHYDKAVKAEEESETLHAEAEKGYVDEVYPVEEKAEDEALNKGHTDKARALFKRAAEHRAKAHELRAKAYEKQAVALDHIVKANLLTSRELQRKGKHHEAERHVKVAHKLSKLEKRYHSDAMRKRVLAKKKRYRS